MKQYSVSLEALKAANPGLNTDLKIDQKIVVPTMKGVEYVVKKGDTLSVIAAKYGVNNLYHILVANDLANTSKIRIGQKLFLPNPTKDPNPKKIEAKKAPVVAKNTKSAVVKVPSKVTVAPPKVLTYGSYSLNLKVEKGCRNFAWGNCTCFVAKYKNVTWR
jgi:LysM repeat protein